MPLVGEQMPVGPADRRCAQTPARAVQVQRASCLSPIPSSLRCQTRRACQGQSTRLHCNSPPRATATQGRRDGRPRAPPRDGRGRGPQVLWHPPSVSHCARPVDFHPQAQVDAGQDGRCGPYPGDVLHRRRPGGDSRWVACGPAAVADTP
ncbi:hypothetical protein I4F81_007151 [Pyropia yezoensis]|uniref:Uncharacterized protein n=1 Tax=Pyropia yezoensis TaxID=2788 RepID=A0ACC3C4C2_PYRYE|nr:hypothetical protein I4F81_007151 [Neopyropia yezoensis]